MTDEIVVLDNAFQGTSTFAPSATLAFGKDSTNFVEIQLIFGYCSTFSKIIQPFFVNSTNFTDSTFLKLNTQRSTNLSSTVDNMNYATYEMKPE